MSRQATPRLIRAILVAFVALVAAGCGGSGSDEEAPASHWDEMNWDQGQWS
jgi:hypothetical protein